MSAKTVIVTGATAGIGYVTAKHISMMGAKVILACRSEDKATQAIDNMRAEYSQWVQKRQKAKSKTKNKKRDTVEEPQPDELNLEFMKLDLTSLKSTTDFVHNYKSRGYSLNVLVCNAGIALPPKELTEDGFEKQFQVNYLSHFLLTLQLLPLLKSSSPGSRIINVSSVGHARGELNLENIQAQLSYSRIPFYGNSKLYQIMSMFSFQRRLEGSGVNVTSLHPGVVNTEIDKTYQDYWMKNVWGFFRRTGMLIDVEKGAATSIDLAVNPEYNDVTGVYFSECKRTTPSSLSRNVEKQEILWKYSLECLKDYLDDNILEQIGEDRKEVKDVGENDNI
uniref:Retinol dehydrogenase 12-like n=1 Tax=Saccoglossus kowalevskii TaxID=10224 RepID=A0ABM0MUM0_SACKO|nr:PREDICTED: retinol dehydrogenase 12-like [Saccoglossus kowalevskii]